LTARPDREPNCFVGTPRRLLASIGKQPETTIAVAWLVFAAICAVRFPWHGLWHDDACYVALGHALASGDYCTTQLPGSPAETRYPPLHPAALALCWELGATPARAWWFVVPGLLIAAIGVWLWGRLLHVHLRMRAAQRAAVLVLAAFAPGWLQVVQCAMSEPWLFTLLPAALLALGRDGNGHAIRAGLLLGLCSLAKSIALVPLVFLAAQLAARRRSRAAAQLLAGAGVLALPWWLWVWANTSNGESTILRYYQGYGGLICREFTQLCEALPERLRDLSSGTVRQAIAGLFTPEIWPALPAAARTVLVAATGAGGVAIVAAASWQARRGPLLFGAACGLWLVALVLRDASWRYTLPVLPVVFALLLQWTGRAWRAWFAVFAAVSLPASVALLQFDHHASARMWRENVPIDGYAQLAAAVRDVVPANAVIATEVDAWLHVQTGRRAVMPAPMPEHTPCARGSAEFAALCRREWDLLGVTHAIVDPRLGEPEKSVLLAAWESGEFELVDCRLAEGFWLLRRR
jgi:hypothetical protein